MSRQRVTGDGVRLILWAGSLGACAVLYVWDRVDRVLHPGDEAEA